VVYVYRVVEITLSFSGSSKGCGSSKGIRKAAKGIEKLKDKESPIFLFCLLAIRLS
jgi:hypothetical protein